MCNKKNKNTGERKRIGVSDGPLRLSAGIEKVEDLVEDLDRALKETAGL